MEYFYSFSDSFGCVHSIDMVYAEYFCVSSKGIIEIVQRIHEKYPMLKYQEHLDRLPCSKWDFYLDAISIGGVYVSAGKAVDYDAENKKFRTLNMYQIRVNPNKYMCEDWFSELLADLLEVSYDGWIRKYDYAIDIPKDMKSVQILDTKKEPGLYKGTRYYGQAGRHGYVKVYDKQKDMKRQGVDMDTLTRVEHTLFTAKEPSLENIYILSNDRLETDYASLKDTEKAIVEMYMQLQTLGFDYKLKLGRKMSKKLEPYLHGQYVKLDYGRYLPILLDYIKCAFKAHESRLEFDGDEFVQVGDLDDLPFD